MVKRVWKWFLQIYRWQLQKQIDTELWDSRLSAKLDAVEILLNE